MLFVSYRQFKNLNMHVYLDLNIFDMIERMGKNNNFSDADIKLYSKIEELILTKKITVPYSNAHLNDLFRGFLKNPNFIDGHLQNIERLTNNLCICQYWNKPNVTWHFRNIYEFFEEKKEERDLEADTLSELLISTGAPDVIGLYKLVPLEPNWKKGYQDPMFGIMFPRAKIENTAYALIEDIYAFQIKLKSDYSLYKKFKTYLIQSVMKLKNNQAFVDSIRSNFKDLPKHLDIFEIADLYAPEEKTLQNKTYSKVLDIFYKYDLKGYKTDGNYNNMFDDSLHTFYASHCDYFITNDDRCKYKAEMTYDKLKFKTKVIKADEIEYLTNCL